MINSIITRGMAAEEPGLVTRGYGQVLAPSPPGPEPIVYITGPRFSTRPDDGGYLPEQIYVPVPTGVTTSAFSNLDYVPLIPVVDPALEYGEEWARQGHLSDLVDELKAELKTHRIENEGLRTINKNLFLNFNNMYGKMQSPLSGLQFELDAWKKGAASRNLETVQLKKENAKLLAKIQYLNDMSQYTGMLGASQYTGMPGLGTGVGPGMDAWKPGAFGASQKTSQKKQTNEELLTKIREITELAKLKKKYSESPMKNKMKTKTVSKLDSKIAKPKNKHLLLILVVATLIIGGIWVINKWWKKRTLKKGLIHSL